MINFGAYRSGLNQGRERKRAQRADNARLYSDFVRNNPDATVEDREKYAESLAGNNKYFREMLPSRSTMETNYKRRQAVLADEEEERRLRAAREARLAAAEKRAGESHRYSILQQQTSILGDAAKNILAPAMRSGDTEAGIAAMEELFKDSGMFKGDFAKTLANSIAYQTNVPQVEADLEREVSNWKTSGASIDKISDIGAGLPEVFAAQVKKAREDAQAIQEDAKRAQVEAATQSLIAAAKSDDPNAFAAQVQTIPKLYPHLNEAEADELSKLEVVSTAFSTAETNRQTAKGQARDDVVDQINEELKTNTLAGSEAEVAKRAERLALEKGVTDPDMVDEIVRRSVADYESDTKVDILNENKRLQSEFINNFNEAERNRSVTPEAVADVMKQYSDIFEGSVDESVAQEISSSIEKLPSVVDQIGVSLSEDGVYEQLVQTSLQIARADRGIDGGPAAISNNDVMQAVDEMMRARYASSGGRDVEAKSFIDTLKNMGVRSVSEVYRTGKFGDFKIEFAKNRRAEFEAYNFELDKNVLTLNNAMAQYFSSDPNDVDMNVSNMVVEAIKPYEKIAEDYQNDLYGSLPQMLDVLGDHTYIDREVEKIHEATKDFGENLKKASILMREAGEDQFGFGNRQNELTSEFRNKVEAAKIVDAEITRKIDILIEADTQARQQYQALRTKLLDTHKKNLLKGNTDAAQLVQNLLTQELSYELNSLQPAELEEKIRNIARTVSPERGTMFAPVGTSSAAAISSPYSAFSVSNNKKVEEVMAEIRDKLGIDEDYNYTP